MVEGDTSAIVRGRIAPTPSGYLHLGNVCNFILNWLWIRLQGGVLRLRIDDLDAPRMREAYLTDIFRVLDWLQLDWDEGPVGPAIHRREFSQHLRMEAYQTALKRLADQGELFACICSRREIRLMAPDGRYPGTCRELERPFSTPQSAWRLDTMRTTGQLWDDLFQGALERIPQDDMPFVVLRRKDGLPAYQLACVLDDQLDQITHVIRGMDLMESTAMQAWLRDRLYPEAHPIHWGHHRLLLDAKGQKQSKSAGTPLGASLLETGTAPADIFQWIAACLGLPGPVRSARSLLERADLSAFPAFELLPFES